MSNSLFEALFQHWLWIGGPLLIGSAALLIFLIMGAVRTTREARISQVSLAEMQEIRFAEAGPVVLSLEGPLFSTRFARLEFELRGENGMRVEGHRALFRARSSGLSSARMEYMSYSIPRPGRYLLTTTGMGGPQERDALHSVVFVRPHLGQTVAYVIGIIFASSVFIVSLVFFLLRIVKPDALAGG